MRAGLLRRKLQRLGEGVAPQVKRSKGLLTIPGIAFLDGINLATGLIDPINMWESRTGGGKVATFKHASGTVQILLPPRAVDERAFVRVGNVEG